MYSFRSTINKATLDSRYKSLFAHAGLQKKWKREVKSCRELDGSLPGSISPEDMLTMKFEDLVDVYLYYINYFNNLADAVKPVVKASAEKVFTYDSYKTKIAKFLSDTNNGFVINNCVYCDLSDARVLEDGKRQFVTDHILDKGKCPLVGLSLYNFCPACSFCNTNCKGTQTIGKNREQIKKLGPTSSTYDFEHQVRFVITEKPEALGRIKFDHLEWYKLEFEYNDNDYFEEVDLFHLENRYNFDPNKLQALEWLELAQKSRSIALAFTSSLSGNSIEEEIKRAFHYEERKQAHSLMFKLMEDIMRIR